MFFTDVCAICGETGRSPCAPCVSLLPPPPPLPLPDGLDDLAALFAYEAGGRKLMTSLKYRNRRGAIGWMGGQLAVVTRGHRPEVVTWVPASHDGRRRRGFDAGELIARRLARELRLPVEALLRRHGREVQARRSRVERHGGPSVVATRAARHRRLGTVLLVDDVSTTGSSLTAAAEALRACGFRHVIGAVAARTPIHAVA
jgi:predicted amidophosphoribosyltransferase